MRLLTPITDNNARAVNDLAGVTLTVQNAETGPFAQHLSVGDLDQGDLVLGAKSDDEFLVGFLLAGFVQDTHVGLATVEGFAGFAETTGKTIVNEGKF